MLDARTLIILTAVTLSVTTIAIIGSWYVNRRMLCAKYWAVSYLLLSLGTVLQSTQGQVPPYFSIALANVLISSGFYWAWIGVRIFQYRDGFTFRIYFLLVTGLLITHAVLGLEPEGLISRTILMSGIVASLSLLIAIELLKDKKSLSFSGGFAITVFGIMGTMFTLRLLSAGLLPAQGDLMSGGAHTAFTYLVAIVFNILIAFSYVLMLSERLNMQLQNLADTDVLTGLLSRRAFINRMKRTLSRARQNNTALSFLVLDIDNFKNINDTYGHLTGDELLKKFADVMKDCFRTEDIIGRLGGEEFAIAISNIDKANAVKVAERLRNKIENVTILCNDTPVSTTVSIGVADLHENINGYETLFREADAALYQAKNMGRNRIIIAESQDMSVSS